MIRALMLQDNAPSAAAKFSRAPVPANVDFFAEDESSEERTPDVTGTGKKRRGGSAATEAHPSGKSRRTEPKVLSCD